MPRRLSLLLAALLLAACSRSVATEPTPTAQPDTTTAVPTLAARAEPSPTFVQTPTTGPTATATPAEQTPTTEATQPAPPTATTAAATATSEAVITLEPIETVTSETATLEPVETATSEPATTPEPNATAEVAGGVDDPARIAAAEPLERDQTTLVEQFKNTGDLPDVARTTPLEVAVGDVETFWVANVLDDTNYTVTARLRYAGPVVLMYVDTSVEDEVDQEDIEQSAATFEEEIYPRTRELFGEELSPGIDGDPRLTILNMPVQGAGGYFSSADGVVKAVNRFSNEREMFVIGIDSYPLGTDAYAATLAHEFQHMIEWHVARRSPSWFNEGMSTLAEDLNGYISQGTAQLYLANPDIQLTTWSSDAAQTGEHYGTSQLFMRYFYEEYGGDDALTELIEQDAGNNLELFAEIAARTRPDITDFAALYADWAVANVLNAPEIDDGRYAYDLLPGSAALSPLQAGEVVTTVRQFGVDYLGGIEGPLTLSFDGQDTVGLTGAEEPASGDYMWWSKRGDDTASTLTRAFDLSGVEQATLEFSTWYEIELDWDYAFVSVSTDDGATWTTLEGETTTTDDPQGQNLGNGLTGVSGAPGVEPDQGTRAQWIEERMDLTPFAGQSILLRFWLVQDASYNAQGMLLDNIRIPELEYRDDAEVGDGGWEAQGFVRTTGTLPQEWRLRLLRGSDGQVTIEEVPTDDRGRATVRVEAGERALLAVIGATHFTSEPAAYTYTTTAPPTSGQARDP